MTTEQMAKIQVLIDSMASIKESKEDNDFYRLIGISSESYDIYYKDHDVLNGNPEDITDNYDMRDTLNNYRTEVSDKIKDKILRKYIDQIALEMNIFLAKELENLSKVKKRQLNKKN